MAAAVGACASLHFVTAERARATRLHKRDAGPLPLLCPCGAALQRRPASAARQDLESEAGDLESEAGGPPCSASLLEVGRRRALLPSLSAITRPRTYSSHQIVSLDVGLQQPQPCPFGLNSHALVAEAAAPLRLQVPVVDIAAATCLAACSATAAGRSQETGAAVAGVAHVANARPAGPHEEELERHDSRRPGLAGELLHF